VALVVGGLLLFDTGSEALRVSVPAVVGAGVVLGTLVVLAGRKAIAARRSIPVTGTAGLVGEVGTVRAPLDPVGQLFVNGALWRARPAEGEAPIGVGGRARVQAVDGLTLEVRAAPGETQASEGSKT
jgi:membrane-bound serine protease (ClpP class)